MVEGISVMHVLSKRRIISAEPSMEADKTQAKIMAVAKELGREIHLFPTSATPSNKSLSTLTSHSGESEDFYDFTKEDYYRVLKHRKEERFLKTCKIREAEEAKRRSKITKAVIRVCFPNNYTLEAKFHPLDFLLLITAYGKLGDFIRAERVLKYMNKHGYPPSVISDTALMEAYGTGGQYSQAESIFRRMQSSGPEPSPLTYHIMLKICVKGNRYQEAEEIFETLLNDEMSRFKPDQQMFNLMIYMYGKAGSYDQARKIFGKMAERGIPRSARTFNSLMSFETNYKEVSSIYDQMQRADIQPDVVSYTFLIRAYAKARREEEALAVFEEMLDASVRPTLDAYNTLLDAFAISGMVEQARTVLKSMRRDRCTPNLHSYTMMLSAFVNASDMDGAEKFFRQIKQDGFKPNVVTYGTLMKGYGKVNNLEKMMSVYEEMRMQGIKANEIIFTTIMDAHGKNEDFGSAVVWFKEMQTSEFPPDQKAKNVLLSLAKSAEEKKEADELVGNAIQDLREEEVCDFSEFNDADRDDAVQNFGPFEEQQDGLVLTNNDHNSTAEITESTEFDDDDEDHDDEDDDYNLLDFVSFKESVLGS